MFLETYTALAIPLFVYNKLWAVVFYDSYIPSEKHVIAFFKSQLLYTFHCVLIVCYFLCKLSQTAPLSFPTRTNG